MLGNEPMDSDILSREKITVITQTPQLKSFVSAPAGTDLSELLKTLDENNIHILDPNGFAPGAIKMTDKIIDGLNHADLMVAVLGTANSSGNVLFELGCASALGKKSLVIVPEDYEIPSDIRSLVHIRTTPNNREAINFALEQILNAPESVDNQQTDLTDLSEKSKPLGTVANNLLKQFYALSNNPIEREIIALVTGILRASRLSFKSDQRYPFTENIRTENIRPDLVVWIDELEPYFGNPILIEVKKKIISSKDARATIQQVLNYLSVSHLKLVIVLAIEISPSALEIIASEPDLYFFELPQILDRLQNESFSQIIVKERNARVHGRLD
jgi:hypothetical protein